MKISIKILVAVASIAAASTPAFARDSKHLICAGYMAAQPASDNYGIAVQFDEHRASDGESRDEMLSTVWAGNLYQGTRLNKGDGLGKNGSIVMASKENSKNVFYEGTYSLVDGGTAGKYKMRLNGKLNLDPESSSINEGENISTTLNCVDISN